MSQLVAPRRAERTGGASAKKVGAVSLAVPTKLMGGPGWVMRDYSNALKARFRPDELGASIPKRTVPVP